MLTVGSLFTGIGGLDLGLIYTGGFSIVYHVENNEYCRSVLEQRYPDTPTYGDITDCSGPYALTQRACPLPYTDVLVGGFPCQDISQAGGKAGIDRGEKSGLWREFVRLIGEVRPRYVIVENVAALRHARKKTKEAAGLGRVLGDLAQAGYDAEWQCLRASDFGAPHQRDRIFIVAYSRCNTTVSCTTGGAVCPAGDISSIPQSFGRKKWDTEFRGHDILSSVKELAYPTGTRLPDGRPAGLSPHATQTEAGLDTQFERSSVVEYTNRQRCEEHDTASSSTGMGHDSWAVVTPWYERDALCGVGGIFDGTSYWLDFVRSRYRWPARPGQEQYAWEPPRVLPKGTGKNRTQRIKALGNAVVPACSEYVGYCLLDFDRRMSIA